jgi:hypothetical protein
MRAGSLWEHIKPQGHPAVLCTDAPWPRNRLETWLGVCQTTATTTTANDIINITIVLVLIHARRRRLRCCYSGQPASTLLSYYYHPISTSPPLTSPNIPPRTCTAPPHS